MSGSSKRRILSVALAAGLAAAAVAAQGQDFPNRRIIFVVSVPPGASSDGLARIVADRIGPRLGQSVVVENKPGAGSFIGHDFAAKAAPDGHTWLLGGQTLASPREMFPIKEFDPGKLTGLGRIASSPFIVVIPADVPAKTLQDFIAHARANPGKLNYGVVPNSTMQLDMIQFGQTINTNIVEVPFNGATPIANALLGSQIQMGFLSVSAIPHIQAGKLKALAVTARNRWSRLPDVPSMGELGIDFQSGFWYGLAVPTGTPQPIQDRISRELAEVMKIPDVRELVVKMGMDPLEPSPVEMAKQLQRERVLNETAYRLLKPAGK